MKILALYCTSVYHNPDSGYQAAVLAHLARVVYTVERHKRLAEQAAQVLAQIGQENVHIHVGDGTQGWPEFSPYNGILTTAAAPSVPQPLLDQLAENGRLVLPVGGRGGQYLERWTRQATSTNTSRACRSPSCPWWANSAGRKMPGIGFRFRSNGGEPELLNLYKITKSGIVNPS